MNQTFYAAKIHKDAKIADISDKALASIAFAQGRENRLSSARIDLCSPF